MGYGKEAPKIIIDEISRLFQCEEIYLSINIRIAAGNILPKSRLCSNRRR